MKIFQLIDWLTKLFKLNNKAKVIFLILLPLPIFSQNNAAFWLGKRASGAAPTNLLLDDYPGAAAAYSVRKLDKDYTGFAMEIRRASDNATQNIGFVGEDLDEVAINSFCSGTTCTVRTWYDQSGNGRDASMTTDNTSQPLIYSSGSIFLMNGQPALSFDGVNDYLFHSGELPINLEFNFFMVFAKVTHVNNEGILCLLPNSGEYDWASKKGRTITMRLGASQLQFIAHNNYSGNGFSESLDVSILTYNLGTQILLSGKEVLGTAYGQINNNTSVTDSYLGIPENPTGVLVGARYPTNISSFGRNNYNEIILYGTDQSQSENIKSNINTYYSIY